MYYRYNGVWLNSLLSGISGDYSIKLVAKDGSKTEITSNVALYFAAYNNTQSKTSTNIPEEKRVTNTYNDAKIIIPSTGVNITGSSATDYTTAGKDVDVFMAQAEGLEITYSLYVNLTAGWNTFSTPVALDPDLDTLNDLLPGNTYDVAFGFDAVSQSWKLLNGASQVQPCQAIYIKMKESRTVPLTENTNLTSPPCTVLSAGWNLVGLANLQSLKANEALVSVYEVTGGLIGYSQVVSQGVGSQKAWVYIRDQIISPVEDSGWLQPFRGYWVFMVNPGILAGFSTTP
jgi:hypothetical protein